MLSNETSKTALVLAGGGLSGAVYEIGALQAIDALLVDRDVGTFDIIVGTSAGALVGSMLASGVMPNEMMAALEGAQSDSSTFLPRHLFSLNTGELVKKGSRLPLTLKNALIHYVRHRTDMNVFDVLWSLIEALPSGIYNNRTLAHFVQTLLTERGLEDSFSKTLKQLYIIATDLDTGERVIFGREPWHDVPISQAVAASSAVPLLYQPVRIKDHEFIDGAVRGNASLDVAIEAGARLIVCINPLVPIDNSEKRNIPLLGKDGRFLSEKGAQAVFSQFMRISLKSGLAYHIKQLRRRHPDVDIILIEPRANDFQMAFYNIMRYSARVTIARHGFESVTIDLANQYHELKATLARHGIQITRRFVIEELEAIRESNYDIKVVRKMLERSEKRRQAQVFATQAPADRSSKPAPIDSFRAAMAELEQSIARLEKQLE
ncbi:MAG: patatin family protein [Chloroflexi bacterium]|nr:patatin family protein [Chloroflexota bacterium]